MNCDIGPLADGPVFLIFDCEPLVDGPVFIKLVNGFPFPLLCSVGATRAVRPDVPLPGRTVLVGRVLLPAEAPPPNIPDITDGRGVDAAALCRGDGTDGALGAPIPPVNNPAAPLASPGSNPFRAAVSIACL